MSTTIEISVPPVTPPPTTSITLTHAVVSTTRNEFYGAFESFTDAQVFIRARADYLRVAESIYGIIEL